jgi:hypothetical protein
VEPDLVDDSGAMTAMSASGDDQPPEVTAGLPPSAAHSSAGMPAGPLPEGARCLTQFIWLLEHVQDAVTWHRQQARSGSYERTAFGTTNRLDRSPRPVSRSRPCAHNDLSVRPQRRDRPTGLARIGRECARWLRTTAGPEPARFLAVHSPAGFEQFSIDVADAERQLGHELEPAELIRIASRQDWQIVGPPLPV